MVGSGKKGLLNCLWFVVCGLWFVVCGLWFVVCGLLLKVAEPINGPDSNIGSGKMGLG